MKKIIFLLLSGFIINLVSCQTKQLLKSEKYNFVILNSTSLGILEDVNNDKIYDRFYRIQFHDEIVSELIHNKNKIKAHFDYKSVIINGKTYYLDIEENRSKFHTKTGESLPSDLKLVGIAIHNGQFKLDNKKIYRKNSEGARVAVGDIGGDNCPSKCTSGGTGAVSCSIDEGDIGPIGGPGCSVECGDGYYACCDSSKVKCGCCEN